MRDFDRPLDATGRRDAITAGQAMKDHALAPEITLCSGALRCRQTLEGVQATLQPGRVVFLEALYMSDATGYLDLVRQYGQTSSLMIVGHNPMMEDLAVALAATGAEQAMATLASGFPTSGLAVLYFEKGLAKAAPDAGHLELFLSPGEV